MGSPLFPRFNRNSGDSDDASGSSASGKQGSARRTLRSVITSAVQKKLGDVGTMFSALFGSAKKNIDMQVAAAVEDELRKLGELDETRHKIPPVRPDYRTAGGQRPDDDDWRLFPEYKKPLIEGPVYCIGSSNVYSFSYEFAQDGHGEGSILVRFLGGDSKNRVGPGPCYKYRDCPYSMFESFKRANSSGGWVWSNLRVRGSAIGHQKPFELVDTGDSSYVPRAIATKRGETGNFYTVRNFNGRRSTLPERKIGSQRRSNIPGWERRNNLRLRAGGN